MTIHLHPTTVGRCAAAAACLWLLTALGCGDGEPRQSQSPLKTKAADDAPPPPLAVSETWDVISIRGQRVGYGRTNISHAIEGDRKVTRIEQLQQLTVTREKDTVKTTFRVLSVETPDGKLLRFESESPLGKTAGKVAGERLTMETVTPGKRVPSTIAWSAEYAGPFALEQTLLHEPMQPGQRRKIECLEPLTNQVAAVELAAKDYGPVKLLDGAVELLCIDTVTRLPDGNAINATVWTDRTGQILKMHQLAMNLETYRTTKTVALAGGDAPRFDLSADMAIGVERALEHPRETRRIRYRVQLKGGDPAAVFVVGPSQRVKSVDAGTAEVTVYAVRPGREDGNRDAPQDPPTAGDREPNNMLQSDDPQIVAEARQVVADEKEPWKIAVALEAYVNREIVKKNFSQVFATAAEVVKNREGDCTEHAVFLAALARARGIPARTAIGLVYVGAKRAFLYHMWTEVYVDNRWIPLDATVARGGTDAAYLKLAQSNLKGASAATCLLPVAQVLGRLTIEIEDVE